MTHPGKEALSRIAEDMLSSPVDDISVISRPQLEAIASAFEEVERERDEALACVKAEVKDAIGIAYARRLRFYRSGCMCHINDEGDLTSTCELHAAVAAAPAVLVEAPKVKALEWSPAEKPDGKSSFYDHCSAESAIGEYVIEWKSWKADPGFTIESALGWFGCEYSLDDAKAAAQADYERRILSALKSEEPK